VYIHLVSRRSAHLNTWIEICFSCDAIFGTTRRLETPGVENRRRFIIISQIHSLSYGNQQTANNKLVNYLQQYRTIYKQTKRKQNTSTNRNCFCRSRASENRPRDRTRSNRSRKSAPVFDRVAHMSSA